MDFNDSDTFSDIKMKIKTTSPRPLPHANTLSLYKAPKEVGLNTEPGVTVGEKDEINATNYSRTLHGMFAETNAFQVIVRPPSKNLVIVLVLVLFSERYFVTFC